MSSDVLSEEEKAGLMNALANFAGVLIAGYEERQAVEIVDDAMALAKIRVASGEWSPELAKLHVSMSCNAAIVSYSASRRIEEHKVREAFTGVLRAVGKLINGRVGFKLLPEGE